MGASGFKFVIDPLESFGFVPLLIMITAVMAAVLSLTEIKRIRASECLNSGLE